MSIKHTFLLVILVLALLFVCGCSEAEDDIITPTETPTMAPETPAPRPTHNIEAGILVINAEITSGNEMYSTSVMSSKLNTHAGYANILIEMNTNIDNGIIEYVYINDEPIESVYIDTYKNKIRIYLSDSLPYFYTLQIKSGYKKADAEMTDDYTLDFLHEEALKYEISYYNFQLKEESPKAIYLTENNPSFLIKFNKPVVRDTLKFIRSFFALPETTWHSDTEVLITYNNLNNGRHIIGIESVEAQTEMYGNKLTPKSTYGETFLFNIRDRQNIYSVVPETNKVSVVTTLEYGSFFESISNDSKNLTIEIVTDDEDGFIYTRAMLNLNLKTLTTFNSFLSSSLSDATNESINIKDETEYNPYIKSDYWNNDDEYIYFHDNNIYSINPQTFESEKVYENKDNITNLYPILHLKNGNYAAINTPFNTNDFLSLVVIDSSGQPLNEYQIPLKDYVHDGVRQYSPTMEETDDGNIFIKGFDIDVENGPAFKTFKINPEDGTLEILLEKSRYLDVFPDLGYGIYYIASSDYSQFTMVILTLDGTLLKSHPIDSITVAGITYNPHKNVFYIVNSDYYTQSCTISILDAVTLELENSELTFTNFVKAIGISETGELLLMDIL